MYNYFRVIELPGFEGLVVKTDEKKEDYDNFIHVFSFFDTNDNSVVDLPMHSVCIAARFLQPVSFFDFAQLVQVDEKTLTGKYLYEGTFVKGKLHVAYTMYEKSIAVSIFELHDGDKQNTLYTQNFFDEKVSALECVEDVMMGRLDVDDLVFTLRDLKESELRGE